MVRVPGGSPAAGSARRDRGVSTMARGRAPALEPAFGFAAWLASGAVGAVALAGLGAGAPRWLPQPACWMRQVAHLSCPTCGLTRSLVLLANDDLLGSLAIHPLGPALVAQLAVGWALWGMWLAGGLRHRPDRWLPHAIAVNALAFAGLWVVRLLTGTLPAP